MKNKTKNVGIALMGLLLSFSTVAAVNLNNATKAVDATMIYVTSIMEFKQKCNGRGVDDKGNEWSIYSDAAESNFEGGDTGRGIHYGTSNAAVSYLSLNAEFQDCKIAQVVVWCADGDSSATVVANINGDPIGAPQTITNTNDAYVFNVEKGSEKEGSLSINISRGSKKKALYCREIRVTYLKEPVPVTGVSLDKERAYIEVESTELLTASVTPDNADNKNVTWTSGDDSIATVDSNGIITGVGVGVTTITVRTNDGGYTDTCAVYVTQNKYLVNSETLELTSTYSDGSNERFEWKQLRKENTGEVAKIQGNSEKQSILYNTRAFNSPIKKIIYTVDESKKAGVESTAAFFEGDSCGSKEFVVNVGKNTEYSLSDAGTVEIVLPHACYYVGLEFTKGVSYFSEIYFVYGQEETSYNIDTSGLNYINYDGPSSIFSGRTLTANLLAESGYYIQNDKITVTMNGDTIPNAYDNGVITVENVRGNIAILGEGSLIIVESISVSNTLTIFKNGDQFNKGDAIVMGLTSNGDEIDVTNACEFTVDNMQVGIHNVTVSYSEGEKTTTYSIRVYQIDSFMVDSESVAIGIMGNGWELNGIDLKITYGPDDGKIVELVPFDDVVLSTQAEVVKNVEEIPVSYNYKNGLYVGNVNCPATLVNVYNETITAADTIVEGKTGYHLWEKEMQDGNKYLGASTISNNAIQITSGSKSIDDVSTSIGIIQSKSVGFAGEIRVSWNSNTAANRDLLVYGKNEPYESLNELSDSDKQGKLLATIHNGTTEVDFEEPFKYIAMKSKDGAIYLDSITLSYINEVPKLVSIQVVNQTKEFKVNEQFVFDGTVVASYDNESVLNVTDLVQVSSPDMTTAGEKEITVTYVEGAKTVTATYTINVKGSAPTKSGCGGSIIVTSMLLSTISLAGAAIVLTKKRKNK